MGINMTKNKQQLQLILLFFGATTRINCLYTKHGKKIFFFFLGVGRVKKIDNENVNYLYKETNLQTILSKAGHP